MAGVVRFELTDDGVRVRCLTAWRYPNIVAAEQSGRGSRIRYGFDPQIRLRRSIAARTLAANSPQDCLATARAQGFESCVGRYSNFGRGSRIRTCAYESQSLVPYRLAIPLRCDRPLSVTLMG